MRESVVALIVKVTIGYSEIQQPEPSNIFQPTIVMMISAICTSERAYTLELRTGRSEKFRGGITWRLVRPSSE